MINNIDNLIKKSTELLINQSNHSDGKEENSSIIFTGNIHDSFPRRLITDPYLTPRDKLAWQQIRLYSQQNNQGAVFPSYNELQTILATLPCNGAKASRSTVSCTLLKLRLTRWISLCQTVRNQHTGTVIGNIYFLHDEPLSVIDAMRFDLTYLDLLQKCIYHSNSQVRIIAEQMTTLIVKNKNFSHLISYMSLYEERLKNSAISQIILDTNSLNSKNEFNKESLSLKTRSNKKVIGLSEKTLSSKTRLSKKITEPSEKTLSSKTRLSKKITGLSEKTLSSKTRLSKKITELSGKSISYSDLSDTTSTSTSIYINTSTSILLDQINWPQAFSDFDGKNKIIFTANKLGIDINLFNAVIFEVSERTKRQTINNITAYTINTLKKAAKGLFNQYIDNKIKYSESEINDEIFKETNTIVTTEKVMEKLNEVRNALTQTKIN